MAQIIKSGELFSNENEEIPFVPAYDLYEAETNKLKPEEIAAIGMTLFTALSPPDESRQVWERYSWIEGISGREP